MVDSETYGGAVLLGLSGTVVIAHGSSRARGVTSACLLAADLEQRQITEKIKERLGSGRHFLRRPLGHPKAETRHRGCRLHQRLRSSTSRALAVAPIASAAVDRLMSMADPQQVLAQRVRHALAAAFGPEHADDDPVIRPSQFADYQANVALPLGKRLGRPPREVAAELARHLDVADVHRPPEVSGPGFINLTLRDEWIAGQATGLPGRAAARRRRAAASRPRRSWSTTPGRTWPRRLHVGHLRATVVGDAIVRVLEHLGHEVVRAAHLGDWGTQFGMLIEHALDVGDEATREQLGRRRVQRVLPGGAGTSSTPTRHSPTARGGGWSALQAGDEESLRLWRDARRRLHGVPAHGSTTGSASRSPTPTWIRRASTTRCWPTSAPSSSRPASR